MPDRILVVDDERNIIMAIRTILTGEGHAVEGAASAEEGLAMVASSAFDAVFLDIELPGIDGLEALSRLRAAHPNLPVVMVSGNATVERAVEATRRGALDFLEKPFSRDRLLLMVRNAMELNELRRENERLRGDPLGRIIGQSAPVARLRDEISRIGPTEARVLIPARAAPARSWWPAPCTTSAHVRPALRQAQLRGHPPRPHREPSCSATSRAPTPARWPPARPLRAGRRGHALPGRDRRHEPRRPGQGAARAAGGRVRAVGGSAAAGVDVRVLAATHKDLRQGAAEGWFREDLYYRLEVVPVVVPPLRERGDDMALLLESFLQHFAAARRDAPSLARRGPPSCWRATPGRATCAS